MVGYDAPATRWGGTAMHLADRADNILARLLAEPALRVGNIMFVAHSLGGLVVKQILRNAERRSKNEPDVEQFLHRVRRVAFLGTPHSGADLAGVANLLKLIVRPSAATLGLKRNDPALRDLNLWYRAYVRKNALDSLVLFETRRMGLFGTVVKADSSDPGLPSDPIPVDCDHDALTRPKDRGSDVYIHIRDFVSRPLAGEHRDMVVEAQLRALTNETRVQGEQFARSLETMAHALGSQAEALSRAGAIAPQPIGIIDTEAQKRLERLLKSRFYGEFNSSEEADRLANAVLGGELSSLAPDRKVEILSWCARILAFKSMEKAGDYLEHARILGSSAQLNIAEAILLSTMDESRALERLACFDMPEARTGGLVILINKHGSKRALAWLAGANIPIRDLDSEGKFFVIHSQLENEDWEAALTAASTLSDADYERTPILLHVAASAHLVQAVPEELRALSLQQLPFDARSFPLSAEVNALDRRREARDLYSKSAEAARSLGLEYFAKGAEDTALWLGLRDPEMQLAARSELEISMRSVADSLRRLPLALQFDVKVDLGAVEREIDRQTILSAGTSIDAAVARLALAFTQKNPAGVADYIAHHRDQLERHIRGIDLLEVDMLVQSGQRQRAEQRLDELTRAGLSHARDTALRRIIAESTSSDLVEQREAEFVRSGLIGDLVKLVDALEERKDWHRLSEFAQLLFERTQDLSDAIRVSRALYEDGQYDQLIEFTTRHNNLITQSEVLQTFRCWSLYQSGALVDAYELLKDLRSKRDDPSDRQMLVSIAIASGNWEALLAFVEEEWNHRETRSAEELVRAAQLAKALRSLRLKDLLYEAARKGADDPAVLVGCYSIAIEAGVDETADIASWIQTAAKFSGENGPVRQVSLRDMLDMNPGWEKHERETWTKLEAGELPLFAAAKLLNRTLVSLVLQPALANRIEPDPRRRSLIYARSGARPVSSSTEGKVVAIDPTSLLTLGALELLDPVEQQFDCIVIAHSTLGWLFEEQQRIAFHQPSRIRDAQELKQFIGDDAISVLEPSVAPDVVLANDVGDDLATLLAEAQVDRGADARQWIVVRPAPVHRMGSLMEEEADLSQYRTSLCGCREVVEKLRSTGAITAAEERKALSYLALQEKPWPHRPVIEDGAVLLMDDLAVTYLQHLGLLGKVRSAGLRAIVSNKINAEADQLIRYAANIGQVSEVLGRLRRWLSEGIRSGKVRVGPRPREVDGDEEEVRMHPSVGIVDLMKISDSAIINDRYFNQHPVINADVGMKPLYSVVELVESLHLTGRTSEAELLEHRTTMRRFGFVFIPVDAGEIQTYLSVSDVAGGNIVESAELRAIRENILRVRMTDTLQIPTEWEWLNNTLDALLLAIKSQWCEGSDEEVSRARSNWLWAAIDARGWSHRDPSPDESIVTTKFHGQLLSLLDAPDNVPPQVKEAYWQWLTDVVLSPLNEEEPQVFEHLLAELKALIDAAVEEHARGAGEK